MIGLGNELRGDDAAGLEVARRLRDLGDGILVRQHEGEPIDLIELWSGAAAVVLVDATRSGAPPGTIHRIDASAGPVPARLARTSSHTISAAEAIELGRTLRRLPATVVVYGVEGQAFSAGAGLSDPVRGAIDRAVSAVRREALGLRESRS